MIRPIEPFDERILIRLARLDVPQFNTSLRRPRYEVVGREVSISMAKAFRTSSYNIQCLESSPAIGNVAHKIQGLRHIGVLADHERLAKTG